MVKINKLWEERSRRYKMDPRGVLPKSYPGWLNKILHNWMYDRIKSKIKNQKSKILDLGCGYGRVAKEILDDFPDAKVYGVDISKTYVDLFNDDLSPRGQARVADIRRLPFRSSFFDMVFMVTTLMYMTDPKDQEIAAQEIFRVLKPKGKFVFIERNPLGHSLFTLGGIITKIRGKKHKEIESVSFKEGDMTDLIKSQGGKVFAKMGFPFWRFLTPSLYIAYSGEKV